MEPLRKDPVILSETHAAPAEAAYRRATLPVAGRVRDPIFTLAGRTSYPLLFDRNYQPKPAFDAVVRVAGR